MSDAPGRLRPPNGHFSAAWRRFTQDRAALIAILIFALIALVCFAGPLFFPFDGSDADFENISAPADLLSIHPLGTDEFGRDVLIRLLEGLQPLAGFAFFITLIVAAIRAAKRRAHPGSHKVSHE